VACGILFKRKYGSTRARCKTCWVAWRKTHKPRKRRCQKCGHPIVEKGVFGRGRWCADCQRYDLVYPHDSERKADQRAKAAWRRAWYEMVKDAQS
jgi:DNA-directed RNA polymerase subunit RPC12/RpoP